MLRLTPQRRSSPLPCQRGGNLPSGDAWKVRLPEYDLSFFWPSEPDHNLHFVIEQEFSPTNPHHYTTTPIQLTGDSTVLDVGACEGLFAFRALREQAIAAGLPVLSHAPPWPPCSGEAREVNGQAEQITIETSGVGNQTGQARMVAGDNPDAGYLEYMPNGSDLADAVAVTTIDDYCESNGRALGPGDLIKADAEGADLDVLFGAEKQICKHAPQLAITTYHVDDHAERMIEWLRQIRPDYKLRLKGLSFWTTRPRPVLLQASTL